jgi:class 3 adenylate cyclase/tetratricopeptide (TPR) repeat protein/ribosomal protein L40E
MICSNCQTENPEGAKFCMNCGIKLALVCPQCGTELPPGAKFCFNCGYQIVDSGQSPVTGEQPLNPTREAVAQRHPQSPTPSPQPPSTLDRFIPRELATKLEAARNSRAMEGERRVVTMLFCDVVGSTATAQQLDPEEWTEIINGAFEHMIRPVYTYEGTVGRLMGDAILAFFGAPIAHEDDPQRAVLAGLGIVDNIKQYRQQVKDQWGVDFDVRVGINTGLVVVGAVGSDLRMEYTAMGDAINIAARMEQTAQPGTVQIAENTQKQVYPFFNLEDLGAITVKGQNKPIRTYQVLERKAAPGRLRGIKGLDAPLIGRAMESQQLDQAVANLGKGVGSVVCLIGEAGLGKSRLIRELHSGIRDQGPGIEYREKNSDPHTQSGRPATFPVPNPQWLDTSSLSYETEQPYGLFQRLIRRVISATQSDSPEILREKIGLVAEDMPPEERRRLKRVFESLFGLTNNGGEPPLEGEAFKGQLYNVMALYWRHRASQQPVILVYDDIHWSDPASVDLLLHLFPLTERLPLLFLCAMRPDRQVPGWQVKIAAETNYPHRYREILLKPLSPRDSDELVNHLLTVSDLPPGLRARILEKSEGNPFFVEEVIRTLIEQGVVIRDESGTRWQATSDGQEIDIPGNLQTLLMARIDRLEEDARQTLQLASVVGRSFYFRVLDRITNMGEELDAQLLTLQRTELIQEESRIPELEYIFRHNLTQEAAYNTILLRQRRVFHQRVGEAIEMLFPDQVDEMAATLAHHFFQARDHEQALKYYTQAGDGAFRLYALSEAIDHYGRAIDCAEKGEASSEQWIYLFTRRGRAQELSDQFDQARANYEEMAALAERRDDQEMKLAYLIALGTVFSTHTPLFDVDQGRTVSEQALSLAQELGDRRGEAKALWNLMLNTIYGPSDTADAVRYGEASLAIARELGWNEQLAFTLNDLAFVYGSLGQPRRSLEVLAEAQTLWREMGNLPMLTDNLNVSSLMLFLTGDTASAIEAAEEGYEIALSVGNVWNQMAIKSNNSLAYRERGDFDRAIQDLENIIHMSEELDVPDRALMALLYLPLYHADLGQIKAGFDHFRRTAAALDKIPAATRDTFQIDDIFFAFQARLYLLDGDLPAAQEAIQRIQFGVAPVIVFPFADIHIFPIVNEITLKSNQVDRALEMGDAYIRTLENAGLYATLPDAYYLRGLAFLAKGEIELAKQALTTARIEAEAMVSRRTLWRILAELARLEVQLGNAAKAERLRHQAQEIVQYIADHTGSPERHDSFLALPGVQEIFDLKVH